MLLSWLIINDPIFLVLKKKKKTLSLFDAF